jgi:hypothetical protein
LLPDLRHLLQAADPVPKFVGDVKISVRDFFTEYLVRRGSRETRQKRNKIFNDIQKGRVFTNTGLALISSTLPDVVLDRKKEIRALSAFTIIRARFDELHHRSRAISGDLAICDGDGIGFTEKVFRVYIAETYFRSKLDAALRKSDFRAYCKNPAQFHKDLQAVTQILKAGPEALGGVGVEETAFAIVTRLFDLEEYRRTRPKPFASFDDLLHQRIERERATLVASNMASLRSKEAWLNDRDMELEQKDEILSILRAAATESNPLSKVRGFQQGILLIKAFVQAEAPPGEELGEDQFLPVTLVGCIFANPLYIVSNCAFLKDFCLDPSFQGEMTLMFSRLSELARQVLGEKAPPVCLSLPKHDK